MASLYQIDQQILDIIDLETGEIIDFEKFEQLQVDKNTKIENIALWYKNLLADAKMFKDEKDAFAEKQKRAENKAESLKRYLDSALGGNKFNTSKVAITYRKSTALSYDGESDVPEEYQKYAEPTIDKKAITEALKNGQEVKGFNLQENQNIQIK